MKNKNILAKVFAVFFISAIIYQLIMLALAVTYPSYSSEADCRSCHGITVDRHHYLVQNSTFQCTDCHAIKYDTQNSTYYPEVIRNCLNCHVGKNHTDIHHLLVQQGLFVCSDCHAILYNNETGQYYPYVTWDCTVCHSTVLKLNDTVVPTPTPPLPNPPTVVNFSPPSPTYDITGAIREFNVLIDQTADIVWSLNSTIVQTNNSVTSASYTNMSAENGIWNVTAYASNGNGNVTFIWTWNVSSIPLPPVITSSFPMSPVNDTIGLTTSRKFGITTDQVVDIAWYINDTLVQLNNSALGASYNNSSMVPGTYDIKVIGTNNSGGNGSGRSVVHSWIWNVYPNPEPITIMENLTYGQNGWITKNTIYLNGTDENGIKYTNYSIDGGDWISNVGPGGEYGGRSLITPVVLSDGIHSIRYYSVDNYNAVESIHNETVNIDTTSPLIIINSPTNGTIYSLNQNLVSNWSTIDITSGIMVSNGTYPNGSIINTSSVGTKNFNVYARDNAGNENTKNLIYYIRYLFGSFLQPINNDGSSIFKLGTTIPIKFQLTDANGNYVTSAVAILSLSKISSTITGLYLEPYTTGNVTTGNIFIYSDNGHFYMYNLATKGMSVGTWQLRVDIDDGSFYTVNISLKK